MRAFADTNAIEPENTTALDGDTEIGRDGDPSSAQHGKERRMGHDTGTPPREFAFNPLEDIDDPAIPLQQQRRDQARDRSSDDNGSFIRS